MVNPIAAITDRASVTKAGVVDIRSGSWLSPLKDPKMMMPRTKKLTNCANPAAPISPNHNAAAR